MKTEREVKAYREGIKQGREEMRKEVLNKLPKKNYLSRFNIKMTLLEKAEESGFNIAVDQMRASIKELKNKL